MTTRRSPRITLALAAGCCLAAGAPAVMGGGASAQTAPLDGSSETRAAMVGADARDGLASMSSPFIPGVAHVPANVELAIGPGAEARYIGPEGSMFNGPADEVDARVDAWWAEQMAAGVSPEEADEILANPTQ